MFSELSLETIRALIIFIILMALMFGWKTKHVKDLKGWNLIIIGFWLLFLGTVIDITDNFPELSKYVIIGDTTFQVILEKFIGFVLGYLCLVLGVWIWLPRVIKQEQKIKKELEKTKNIIKDRTEEFELVVECIASIAEHRDPETGYHIKRTQAYVKLIAENLSRNPDYAYLRNNDTINIMSNSARLHDIGKVGIPDEILLKPGKLTDEEFNIMKQHTVIGKTALSAGAEKIRDNSFLKFAIDIALYHHERWDGTGYPAGIKGKSIPLSARIMALSDAYDAITSKRVYKAALTHGEAIKRIKAASGTHFDPVIVEAFLESEEEIRKISIELSDNINY